MRNLSIIFSLLISFFGNSQNMKSAQELTSSSSYTVCNPDSSGTFQLMFNEVSLSYKLYKTNRCFYYYNSSNKHSNGFLQYCTMSPTDTVWSNSFKWINSYDINSNLTDSVTMYWAGTAWGDSVEHSHYVYDINQNLVSVTQKNKNNNVWNNSLRTIFAYNVLNQISSVTYQNWNLTNTQWRSFDSSQYAYGNNLLRNRSYYRFTTNPNVWTYYANDTTQYNSFNLPIYLLKKLLVNNVWTNQKEIVWSYDTSNRILSRINNDLFSSSNYWEFDYDSYYTYNANGTQILESAGGYTYFSNCIAAGLNEKSKNLNISIFPNPSKTTLSIYSDINYGIVKIINAVGQIVWVSEDKLELVSVFDLSNGIYFIQLLDKKGNLLKTEKFIKE